MSFNKQEMKLLKFLVMKQMLKVIRSPEVYEALNDILEKCKNYQEVKDHCIKCGCNEFLCGHNKRD